MVKSNARATGIAFAGSIFAVLGLMGCSDTPPAATTPIVSQTSVPTFASTKSNPATEGPTNTALVMPTATAVAVLPTMNPQAQAAATQTAGAAQAGYIPTSNSLPGADYFYADATSHSVSGFASDYVKMGGVGGLGYPVTEAFIEQNTVDGKWYWVQYFEKGVIEYHQDDTSANQFQLSPLGVWRFSQKYPNGAASQQTKQAPGKGSYKFAETNHTVNGAFLSYWHDKGEIKRFGYPISESFQEKSDSDGNTYTVQYFERAVMEYHPELKAGNNVQLAALGSMKLKQLYAQGAPSGASNPAPSPTINVQATAVARDNATATEEAIKANATATVVTAKANAQATKDAANAAATAKTEAKQESANATATVRTLAGYASTAPSGTFRAAGSSVAISCKIQYERCTSDYSCADSNSKYILVSVAVSNIGSDTIHVNPLNFTLEGTSGGTVSIDSGMFALNNALDAVDVRPGNYASGWIAFLTTKDFIPAHLVWEEILGETVDVSIVDAP